MKPYSVYVRAELLCRVSTVPEAYAAVYAYGKSSLEPGGYCTFVVKRGKTVVLEGDLESEPLPTAGPAEDCVSS